MKKSFIQAYRVQRNEVEEAYINNIGLKMNEEYEKWADNIGIEILKYFLDEYKGIEIEIPKLREKSKKSILDKIKKLQIERLSKLYAIEGISDKEKQELYSLIEEKVCKNTNEDITGTLQTIKNLIQDETEDINEQEFERNIMEKEISESIKTALLRILVTKIKRSNLPDKEIRLEILSKKYGKNASLITGSKEKDIIKYSSIINIQKDRQRLERLRSSKDFLKANDLRGMKIVVVDIPDNFITDNIKIKRILKERKSCINSDKRILYNHLCTVEIGREFFKKLENNQKLLEKLHIKVIPNSNKHKENPNGYEAEHIKFISTDNPAYTLEMQFKSEYIENMCKTGGKAAHTNRPRKNKKFTTSK